MFIFIFYFYFYFIFIFILLVLFHFMFYFYFIFIYFYFIFIFYLIDFVLFYILFFISFFIYFYFIFILLFYFFILLMLLRLWNEGKWDGRYGKYTGGSGKAIYQLLESSKRNINLREKSINGRIILKKIVRGSECVEVGLRQSLGRVLQISGRAFSEFQSEWKSSYRHSHWDQILTRLTTKRSATGDFLETAFAFVNKWASCRLNRIGGQ
jgi:hypothetical protein